MEIPYAVVGSLASSVWGEPRFTEDIDIVLDITPTQVERLCRAFDDPHYYVSHTAAQDAALREGQFNVIVPSEGCKIDFMVVGKKPWAIAQLKRRRQVPLLQHGAPHPYFAAPEDVILGKLVYFREGGSDKHLRDIAGILKVSGGAVDREYITRFAREIGVSAEWAAVLDRLEKSTGESGSSDVGGDFGA
jgi:hypothetical protein